MTTRVRDLFSVALVLFGTCHLGQPVEEVTGPNPLACEYEELRGYWTLQIGDDSFDRNSINCQNSYRVAKTQQVLLEYPNVVKDDLGNVGFWTMVDSLGFEIVVHGRKFFAYVKFKSTAKGKEVRFCNETILGCSHDALGHNWACFVGRRTAPPPTPPKSSGKTGADELEALKEMVEDLNKENKGMVDTGVRNKRSFPNFSAGSNSVMETGKVGQETRRKRSMPGSWIGSKTQINAVEDEEFLLDKVTRIKRSSSNTRMYKTDLDMIEQINAAQSSWVAADYEEYSLMTVEDFMNRAGNRMKRRNFVQPAPITEEQQTVMASLPDSWDWRNVRGVNYVSPVRDQGKCGSCYAFTSAAMLEARLAIFTNGTQRVVLSPQDVVDCTLYSLACDGGSSYAIGGKYAEDFGMVEEKCNPYQAVENSRCTTSSTCKRYYATGYEFIGGYFGACNEALMMQNLVYYGPLAIAIKVNEDLMFYKTGIYNPTGIKSRFNPFVDVDHAVTLVGYGVDKTHGKYWIIKNSWGTGWGDKGYFYLPRGGNVCGIEGLAVQSFPIF